MVLQHEVLRVRPVVRDLFGRVIAHDFVGRPGRAGRVVDVGAGLFLRFLIRLDETVHGPSIDVGDHRFKAVRATAVDDLRVVVRRDACVQLGIGHAGDRHPFLCWDPFGARIRAEVLIEGAVLLHDHHDVLDLVDALRDRGRPQLRVPPDRDGPGAGRDRHGPGVGRDRDRRGVGRDRDAGSGSRRGRPGSRSRRRGFGSGSRPRRPGSRSRTGPNETASCAGWRGRTSRAGRCGRPSRAGPRRMARPGRRARVLRAGRRRTAAPARTRMSSTP